MPSSSDPKKTWMKKIGEIGYHNAWRVFKSKAIDDMRKIDASYAKTLEKKFSKGLGSELDEITKILKGFPKIDIEKLQKHIVAANHIMAEYSQASGTLRLMVTGLKEKIDADLGWFLKNMPKPN